MGRLGEYDLAIELYLSALRTFEQLKDKAGIARVNNLMGMAHLHLKRYEEALNYFSQALATYQQLNNRERVATCYNNLGLVQMEKGNYARAIELIFKGWLINDSLGLRNKVAVSYNDLGRVYFKKGDYLQALAFFKKALVTNIAIDRVTKIPENYNRIADCYRQLKQYEEAIQYYQTALKKASALGLKEQVKIAYEGLATCHAKQNDFQKAYHYYQLFHQLSDSIFNAESAEKIARMQAIYQTEQQAARIELLTKERQLHQEEAEFRRRQLIGASVILLMTIALAGVFFRNWQHRRRISQELATKNEEIRQKHEEIRIQAEHLTTALRELEKKNSDITASLNYAQRIQAAILPHHSRISKSLPEYFILYRPRDIVSGDFYWFQDIGLLQYGKAGEKMIIAAADCTGHGVPGAFMSLIGTDLLNQVVNLHNVYQPAEALMLLEQGVRKLLQKDTTENRDTIEIGFCYIDLPTAKLYFGGAAMPLYYVKDGELFVIKGDKFAIGAAPEGFLFQHHVIELKEPITCYLCSDGFQDQFGGPARRKFMIKRLREALYNAAQMPFNEQKQYLELVLNTWKGSEPQIDDIMVIGFKI